MKQRSEWESELCGYLEGKQSMQMEHNIQSVGGRSVADDWEEQVELGSLMGTQSAGAEVLEKHFVSGL